ncbi:hypothetical protein JRO89_XS02G0120500 [Xanthoceras sorbifolium]|uniref:Uncharacterized protein n=1 Tax=Xanthoceras sorbifolium TaxID=99658 RepID=A0ABQ8IG35_9ROSI|nr:hypothetical protein JRO89_XS02G0120500 [Xanthoceras sorbifolium]
MANNGKDEASGSAVNSTSNAPTSNQARLAALEVGQAEIQAKRSKRGGRVERGPLRVEHWVDHEDENRWHDEEYPRQGRKPCGRMEVERR